ncbi:(d)CMP kinase [bacterium]|nr:(d)CMP kinase [bacterium]
MKQINDVIAIDGPAASGKTTVASLLAKRLGLLNINTGAMYRALSLKAIRAGIQAGDSGKIGLLLDSTDISFRRRADGSTFVTLDGEDVSEQIRSQEVARAASIIARLPAVRHYMVSRQKKIASHMRAVAEGRDTTTVVFPKARHKFFIDAPLETRARRRYKELHAQGSSISLEQVKEDVGTRDVADCSRKLSPLTRDPDAVIIDSTNLTPEQVVEKIEEHLGQSLKREANPPPAEEG